MATEAQLIAALRAADAAGDRAGATRIAQIIQAQRQASQVNPAYAQGRADARSAAGTLNGASLQFQSRLPGVPEIGAATSAGMGALSNMVQGKPADFGGQWTNARAYQQGLQDEFQGGHPLATVGLHAAGDFAQVLPFLATDGASAAPGLMQAAKAGFGQTVKRAAVSTARNATIGGSVAAVNAASQPGTLQQRAQAATNAFLPGAAVGAVLPAAVHATGATISGLSNIAKPIGAMASEASDAASRALTGKTVVDQSRPMLDDLVLRGRQNAFEHLQNLGATPESLRAAYAAANGAPITTAEAIGPQGISTASGIIRRAGTAPQVADATMAARAADRGARILDHIQSTTGIDPEAAKGNIDAIVKAGQNAAGPLFDAIRAQPGPITSPELNTILQRPVVQQAVAGASKDLENASIDPTAHGFVASPDSGDVPVMVPGPKGLTAQALDLVRRNIGDQVERDAFGRIIPDSQSRGNYNINLSQRDLTNLLAGDGTPANPGLIPGYREALDTSGDYLSTKAAYDRTQGRLFGTAGRDNDPRAFEAYFNSLSPAEQKAAQSSMVNDIYTRLQNGQLRPGSFDAPAVQAKLGTAFGPDAQDLIDRMKIEADMSKASARMTPNLNSTTGDVIGTQDIGGDMKAAIGGAKVIGNAMTGNVAGAAKSAASMLLPFASAARQPVSMATRNALGDLLYQSPEATADALAQYRGQNAFTPTALPTSITSLKIAAPASLGAATSDQTAQPVQ